MSLMERWENVDCSSRRVNFIGFRIFRLLNQTNINGHLRHLFDSWQALFVNPSYMASRF